MQGVILSIAGSDSGGGAGIQADIKTITSLGSYAATAITAITAQNTQGVSAVEYVGTDIIAGQINAVLDDLAVDAIKIGMLGNQKIIETVADTLAKTSIPIVLDPVMIAKGGASLLEDEAVNALKERLIPVCYLLTPNIPEAEALTGLALKTHDDIAKAGKILMEMGAKAALIKGGHRDSGDMVIDTLIDETEVTVFEFERIESNNTHGTGCTLSSAIATLLAQGNTLYDAVEKARSYVWHAIADAPSIGHGHGPLNHMTTHINRCTGKKNEV